MDDLAQWLGEQYDEDERIARAAGGDAWRRQDHPSDTVAVYDAQGEPVVYDEGWPTVEQQAHIVEWDPARVLREIDAKRELLADVLSEPHFRSADDHWNTCPAVVDEDGVPVCLDESRAPGPCDCGRDARVGRRLRLLALPYVDRPGFREGWRP